MRFGLVLTRTALVAVLAGWLVSCGTEETPNLGTIDFNPDAIDFGQLAANAPTAFYGAYARVSVFTPTAQPNTQAKITISGLICTGLVDFATCLANPLNPTGVPVQLDVGDRGYLDLTILFPLTGGADGEVTIVEAWSGTAYNRLNIAVECVDAGAATCP
jgi:hypothetical protein